MKRHIVPAFIFWTSALLVFLGPATAADVTEFESDDDTESDSAPFMVVVEHTNGRRCGGSLVSLRTALTSAWCARGPEGNDPRELWALSPGVPSIPTPSRRVARVALVAGAEVDSPAPHLQPAWLGAALDIAVLELEAPFGGGGRSRPILMATRPDDCLSSNLCHVVRVRGRPPRLRIVDASLVSGDSCSAVAAGWPSLRDSALCLTGPTLCAADRGAGVVCDGKLCGVLSRSARSVAQNKTVATNSPEEADPTCGDVHVALSVARMRRFLHCAHTLRACGRGGECAHQCSERQLMVLESGEGGAGGGDSEAGAERFSLTATTTTTTLKPTPTTLLTTERRVPEMQALTEAALTTVGNFEPVFRTEKELPTRSVPPVTLTTKTTVAAEASPRTNFEFEPNRADFRGAPERTTRVYLKAGEYGDNALDYGEAEESGGGGSGGPATLTTSNSMTSLPTTYRPALMSNTSATETGDHSTSSELNSTSGFTLKTKETSTITNKPAVRLSKLDAQMVAPNMTAQKRSAAFDAARPFAFMSLVVFLTYFFVSCVWSF